MLPLRACHEDELQTENASGCRSASQFGPVVRKKGMQMRLIWLAVLLIAMLGACGCSGGDADVDTAAEKLKQELPPDAKPEDILKLDDADEVKFQR
jgi:hypothetical protein